MYADFPSDKAVERGRTGNLTTLMVFVVSSSILSGIVSYTRSQRLRVTTADSVSAYHKRFKTLLFIFSFNPDRCQLQFPQRQ